MSLQDIVDNERFQELREDAESKDQIPGKQALEPLNFRPLKPFFQIIGKGGILIYCGVGSVMETVVPFAGVL